MHLDTIMLLQAPITLEECVEKQLHIGNLNGAQLRARIRLSIKRGAKLVVQPDGTYVGLASSIKGARHSAALHYSKVQELGMPRILEEDLEVVEERGAYVVN